MLEINCVWHLLVKTFQIKAKKHIWFLCSKLKKKLINVLFTYHQVKQYLLLLMFDCWQIIDTLNMKTKNSNYGICFFPQMVEKNYDVVLIFEDDVRFEPFFKTKMEALLQEADKKTPNWDLMWELSEMFWTPTWILIFLQWYFSYIMIYLLREK